MSAGIGPFTNYSSYLLYGQKNDIMQRYLNRSSPKGWIQTREKQCASLVLLNPIYPKKSTSKLLVHVAETNHQIVKLKVRANSK